MTDPLDPRDPLAHVPAADAAPAAVAVLAAQRAPGGAGRLLKWWLLTSLVLVAACIVFLGIGLANVDVSPLHIVIDGDDVSHGLSISGVDAGIKVVLAIGLAMLALLLLLLVPMILLLVIGAVALALVAGLGVPLLGLALGLVVVSSPLWLVGLFVWLIVRRRPAAPVTIHA
jgi:hypothetical protein